MSTLYVMPAYGRTYEKSGDVVADWLDNKDFKIVGGPYISKKDWEKYGNALDSVVYSWGEIFWQLENGLLA